MPEGRRPEDDEVSVLDLPDPRTKRPRLNLDPNLVRPEFSRTAPTTGGGQTLRSRGHGRPGGGRTSANANELNAHLESLGVYQRPQSMGKRAKKGGNRRGALYTLADIQRNVIARHQEKVRAEQKAQTPKYKSKVTLGSSPFGKRLVGAVAWYGKHARHGPPDSPVRELFIDMAQREVAKQLAHDAAKQRGPGRRGAEATRSTKHTTNRTGAAATRPIDPATSGVTDATRPAEGLEKVAREATKVESPVVTKPATSSSSKTTSSSSTKTKTPTKTPTRTAGKLSTLLKFPTAYETLTRYMSQPRMALRGRSLVGSRARPPATRAPLQTLPGLTSLNSVGVGSQTLTKHCDCPKPRKKDDDRKNRCTNPLISRNTKDGVITIKRKIECQSFSAKPAS